MQARAIAGVILGSLSFASVVFSQSSFVFSNIFMDVNAPVYDAYGVPLEGPGYLAELWGGLTADSLSPAVRYTGLEGRLIAPFLTQGYVRARGSAIVLSVPPGGLVALQMRAWDASLGGTYEEVMARGLGGYGESRIFYEVGGNPIAPLPVPPSPLTGLESFSLRAVIPEPTTWALFAIGGLAVLGFLRRFKSRR